MSSCIPSKRKRNLRKIVNRRWCLGTPRNQACESWRNSRGTHLRRVSLTAAGTGGLLLDYWFLPPRVGAWKAPEHWVAMGTFVVIALVSGRLAGRVTAAGV